MSPARVIVAEPFPICRAAFGLLLVSEGGFEVVGEAGDAGQTLQLVGALKPDLVLMELALPGGALAVLQTLSRHKGTRSVILTNDDDPVHVAAAVRAGAWGYVTKQASPAELVEALRQVLSGNRYIDRALANPPAAVTSSPLDTPAPSRSDTAPTEGVPPRKRERLSPRELEVLRLLALGHTNREIAGRILISEKTAEAYRARIRKKTGRTGRAELVAYAHASGLMG